MKTSRYILLIILTSFHATAYADCPNCFKDQQPLDPLHQYSADGRVRILVGIMIGDGSESWASPPGTNIPNQRLAAAAGQGMAMWNNATDSGGNKTNYYFDTTNGIQPVTSFDILIVKRPVLDSNGNRNPEGEMETGGGRPFKLFVREDVVDRMDDSNLAAFIAHELAHRIGLVDTACAGTIMQNIQAQADGSLVMTQGAVSAQDVHMSRMNYDFATRITCTKLDAKINYVDSGGEAGGSCADGDGDGWTICSESPDCNDADANFTDNCSGCGDDEGPRAYDCYTSGGVWKTMPDCLCDYPYVGPQPGGSPVLLDITGDGFRLTSAADGVLFDLDGDGVKERLGWTAPGSDDAWLALDRDGSGLIENGRELFGNFTPQPEAVYKNGFLALAEYDKAENGGDADGVIDGRDTVFPLLRLWRDVNHDGVSEPNELHALASLDVARLHVRYKHSKRTDGHGNEFRYRAKVNDAKGAKVNRWSWDVFLVYGQ